MLHVTTSGFFCCAHGTHHVSFLYVCLHRYPLDTLTIPPKLSRLSSVLNFTPTPLVATASRLTFTRCGTFVALYLLNFRHISLIYLWLCCYLRSRWHILTHCPTAITFSRSCNFLRKFYLSTTISIGVSTCALKRISV